MELEELRQRYNLPQEVVDMCQIAGLHTLMALEGHVAVHGSFMDLPGANQSIEHSLLNLLAVLGTQERRERDGSLHRPLLTGEDLAVASPRSALAPLSTAITAFQPQDLNLDQISVRFGLSARAYNVCAANGLVSLSAINAFQVQHGEFKKL